MTRRNSVLKILDNAITGDVSREKWQRRVRRMRPTMHPFTFKMWKSAHAYYKKNKMGIFKSD